MPPDDGTPDGR
jgi:hypothetical protein